MGRVALFVSAAVVALMVAAPGFAQTGDTGGSATGTGTYGPEGQATVTLAVTGTPEAATGPFTFTNTVRGEGFVAAARCIDVDETATGYRASVAGAITSASPGSFYSQFQGFEVTVYDRTPSGQIDQISTIILHTQVRTSCAFDFGGDFTLTAGDFTVLPTGQDAAAVTLTPPADVNPVSTSHTVTATATTQSGTPAPETRILFTVAGSVDAQGSCTTNAQGQCSFTYTGPDFPGADVIRACADNNENGRVDPGEPCGEATKIWLLPVTTPGQVTGGGWIFRPGDGSRVSFGFNAKSDGAAVKGNCNVIDHATKTHIKCLTVDTVVVAGTHATLFGQATVNRVVTNYRIDVDDLGEPGTLDTFKFQTDSGYSAAGVLAGGNIQIHR